MAGVSCHWSLIETSWRLKTTTVAMPKNVVKRQKQQRSTTIANIFHSLNITFLYLSLPPTTFDWGSCSQHAAYSYTNVTNEWSDTVALDHVFASVLSRHLFWVGGGVAWRDFPRVKIRLLPKNIPLRPASCVKWNAKISYSRNKKLSVSTSKAPGPIDGLTIGLYAKMCHGIPTTKSF